jgi:hypothetical protein
VFINAESESTSYLHLLIEPGSSFVRKLRLASSMLHAREGSRKLPQLSNVHSGLGVAPRLVATGDRLSTSFLGAKFGVNFLIPTKAPTVATCTVLSVLIERPEII